MIYSTAVFADPTLIYNSWGQLAGANNVIVAGLDYDVSFSQGSCNGIFSSCDPTFFAFNTQSGASAANQALVEQVFNSLAVFNSWDWVFNSRSFCDFGYNSNPNYRCSWSNFSGIYTPYSVNSDAQTVDAANMFIYMSGDQFIPTYRVAGASSSTDLPDVFSFAYGPGGNQSDYAIWTARPDIQVIPEPNVIPLLMIGILGFVLARRRKKI